MGWFRRSSGRHSYGVPVVATPAPAATVAEPALPVVLPTPPREPAPGPVPHVSVPQRLPDDRTTEQIGGKVAEVLWSYYGQQGPPSNPLAPEPALPPVYDDSYLEAQFAAPPAELPPPPAPVADAHLGAVTPVVAAESSSPRYRVFDRVDVRRAHVVQLGFLDGSTLELASDDPAAKALRAAAAALTLRD